MEMSNEIQDREEVRIENGAVHKTIIVIHTNRNNIYEK